MPPKVKPDDFVDALLDSCVVDALAKALSPLINKTIQDAIAIHIGPLNGRNAGVVNYSQKASCSTG